MSTQNQTDRVRRLVIFNAPDAELKFSSGGTMYFVKSKGERISRDCSTPYRAWTSAAQFLKDAGRYVQP